QKSKNGRTAITSSSKYDINGRQWIKTDSQWFDYAKKDPLLTKKSQLSAYGNLLQETTLFSDNQDERYIPDYDNGAREIGGRVFRFNLENKQWLPVYNYKVIQWNSGEITRQKTDLTKGNKETQHTIDSEGLPKQDIDLRIPLTTDNQGNKIKIGEAVRKINHIYDGTSVLRCPLIADKGRTTVEVTLNNPNRRFTINYTESKSENFENGIITLRLEDLLRHYVWHERKNLFLRNRPVDSYRYLNLNGRDGEGVKRLTTYGYNGKREAVTNLSLGFFDVPDNSIVANIYPDNSRETYKSSEVTDYNSSTGNLTLRVTNLLRHLVWDEVKDNLDHLIRITEGDMIDGNLVMQEERSLNYGGVLGAVDVPTSEKARPLIDYPEDPVRKIGGNSFAVGISSGRRLDVNTTNMGEVFDGRGRTRFQRQDTYKERSAKKQLTVYAQGVKNNIGDDEESSVGYLDQQESYKPISNLYLFYEFAKSVNEKIYGQGGIPLGSTRVVYDASGNGYIHAIANSTELNKANGYLDFKTKKGLELGEITINGAKTIGPVPRNNITYDSIREFHANQKGFFTVVATRSQEDNHGRPIIIERGHPFIDSGSGFVNDQSVPNYITFLHYLSYVAIPFSKESFSFEYDTRKGGLKNGIAEELEVKYNKIGLWNRIRGEGRSRSYGLSFSGNDLSYISDNMIKELVNTNREILHSDGRKISMSQLGVSWSGYDINTRLDKFELGEAVEYPNNTKNKLFGFIEMISLGKTKDDFLLRSRAGKTMPIVNLIFEGKLGHLLSVEIYDQRERGELERTLRDNLGMPKVEAGRSLYKLPKEVSLDSALLEVSKAVEKANLFINGLQVATIKDKEIVFLRNTKTLENSNFFAEKKEYVKYNNILQRYSESPWMLIFSLPFIAIFGIAVVLALRTLRAGLKAYGKHREAKKAEKGIKNYIQESFTKRAGKKILGLVKTAVLVAIPVLIMAGVLYIDQIFAPIFQSALLFSMGPGFTSAVSCLLGGGLIPALIKLAAIAFIAYLSYKAINAARVNYKRSKNLNSASREQLLKIIDNPEMVDGLIMHRLLIPGSVFPYNSKELRADPAKRAMLQEYLVLFLSVQAAQKVVELVKEGKLDIEKEEVS
ncbi:MAG: hypothetical protein KKE64_03595, partial [Candidatus Omnitrophica bacterium]|nr:hypothetical protein [Candidatus Omnitrophota bacterium]